MRHMMTKVAGHIASAMLLATIVVPSIVGPVMAETPVRGGTLIIGMPESFKGFSPYKEIGRQGYNVAVNIFDTLTTYGADYVPKPMLAESWEQPDAKTWRFHLRRDVTFHDGTKFDAEAAKFSLERIKEGSQGKNLARVAEVKVIDPYTIDVIVSDPFPTLPAVLTQQYASIVSPTAFQQLGPDEFGNRPIGSGAFKFDSLDSTGSVTLTRNENYWGRDTANNPYPYLDKVVFRVVPDRQTAALSLIAGDVDLNYEVPQAFAAKLKASPDLTVLETPTLGWNFVILNTAMAPFGDIHNRRGAQLAIDRKSIVETVLLGDGVIALGPTGPRSWAYDPAIEKSGFYGATADLAKAKAELAAGGSSNGFAFTMIYPAEDPFNGIAQAMTAQLAATGINVTLEGKDFGAVLDDLDSKKFQALMIDWSGRIDEDLVYPTFFKTGGSNNFGGYSNPKVDELIDKAAAAIDIKERAKLYQEAERLIVQDSPLIWINYPTERKAMRTTVQGYENFGDFRMRLYNVWKKS